MSQNQRENLPDVRQLGKTTLPETPFPGGRKPAFRVFLDPKVHASAWKHASEDVSVEICGVLVGTWARDADGPFILVSESIRGEAVANKLAEVTFTHETWAKINEQMDRRFSDLKIVGWYHSHPGFGIFLSDRDRFIHEHFFSEPGQVAYVVDPVRKTEGVFIWQEGKTTLTPHYWVGDRLQVATPGAIEETPVSSSEHPDGTMPPNIVPAPSHVSWLPIVSQAAMILLAFLLGLFLSGKWSDLERLRAQQEGFARAWLFLKIRPDLTEAVNLVNDDLHNVTQTSTELAKEYLKRPEQSEETKAQWKATLSGLDRISRLLSSIKETYCLTPDEMILLHRLGDRVRKPDEKTDKPETKSPETSPAPR